MERGVWRMLRAPVERRRTAPTPNVRSARYQVRGTPSPIRNVQQGQRGVCVLSTVFGALDLSAGRRDHMPAVWCTCEHITAAGSISTEIFCCKRLGCNEF